MRQALSIVVATLSLLVGATGAPGQDIKVDSSNRTISVSVSESLEVQPEIAVVRVGYSNYGQSIDQTYEENSRTAAKIIEALLHAGVPKPNIETEDLAVSRVEDETTDLTPAQRKEQRFHALQVWTVRVPPSEAQKVVDQAVNAGANEVRNVQWVVADLTALDAKVNAIAVAKARGVAEQMAEKLGGRAGQLLFVSNDSANFNTFNGQYGIFAENKIVTVTESAVPTLKLFHQKIRRDAEIHAVFVLE